MSPPFERLDVESFLQAEMMIYAIGRVNQGSPKALPNFTLGYEIFDTCRDVSIAIRGAIYLLDSHAPDTCVVPEKFQAPLWEPRAKVVIGEKYSEVSIAIARVLALPSVTQVGLRSVLAKQLKLELWFWNIKYFRQNYRSSLKKEQVFCGGRSNSQSVPARVSMHNQVPTEPDCNR